MDLHVDRADCRMKTNLFLVGAAKGGTSTVYDYLAGHPDVFCSVLKEPRYFTYRFFRETGAHREILKRAIKTEDAYLKLYRKRSGQRYAADGSAYALFFPGVARLIHDFCAEASIVILLRNPVERFISHYNMHLRDTGAKETLPEFIRKPKSREGINLLELGLYSRQVEEYFQIFGRKNVHIILFEELTGDFQKTMEKLCGFLQIRLIDAPVRQLNISGKPKNRLYGYFNRYVIRTFPRGLKKMIPLRWSAGIKAGLDSAFLEKAAVSAADRAFLHDYYRDDIIKLEKLLERDLSAWLQNKPGETIRLESAAKQDVRT